MGNHPYCTSYQRSGYASRQFVPQTGVTEWEEIESIREQALEGQGFEAVVEDIGQDVGVDGDAPARKVEIIHHEEGDEEFRDFYGQKSYGEIVLRCRCSDGCLVFLRDLTWFQDVNQFHRTTFITR